MTATSGSQLVYFLGRYFWLVCLAVCACNYFVASRRRPRVTPRDPATEEEARFFLRVFTVVSFVPWLVMGLGQTVGGVPSIWHYFRPQDLNPYVLAFIASIFLISVAFAYWVFVLGGAKKVVELQLSQVMGLHGYGELTEGQVKFLAAAGPPFVALWVLLAVSMNTPIPKWIPR